jgi:ATP-dependent DNA helicase RecG
VVAGDPVSAGDPLALALTRARLPGGPTLSRLRRIGIFTVRDLLFYLPRRYDDLRRPVPLRDLASVPPDEPVSARAAVVELVAEQTFRRRVMRTLATLRDENGDQAEAIWFGRRFIERRLKVGDQIVLTGKVKSRGWIAQFQNPEFGPDDPGALHAGRIVPVYRLTAGVTNATLRRAIRAALDAYGSACPDYLPDELLEELGLEALSSALEEAHYPSSFASRDAALRRLAFDELLALQVGMVSRDRQRRPETAEPIVVPGPRFQEAVSTAESVLGQRVRSRLASSDDAERRASAATFEVRLTTDQAKALDAIRADLLSTRPMLRLLQGDVGSGKTAVAALALAFAADSGRQGALLAPTDLLARQHAATLAGFLEPLGHGVTLLTGSMTAAERRAALAALAEPQLVPEAGLLEAGFDRAPGPTSRGLVVLGTHALLQETVAFRDLGLVVIDEQHRFGVDQREALSAKGRTPHVLLMTATPIPRTLGQVFYADLDVSDLRTPPAGRRPISTGVRTLEELMRRGDGAPGAFPLIAREVAAGHRAFVVVPLVDEDDSSGALAVGEAAQRLEAALPEAAAIAGVPGGAARVGIVHGQMRAADRDATMDAFRRGEVDVLVGTTVVEVGVDVPEASVMLVLNADRFGVAQLHQLRGRVGRGEAQSYCILATDSMDPVAQARLKAVAETEDGFALAEVDFELRQAGDLLGVLQSGLPPLRVASLARQEDRDLSAAARRWALEFVDADGRLGARQERLGRELESGWLKRVGAGETLAEEAAGG